MRQVASRGRLDHRNTRALLHRQARAAAVHPRRIARTAARAALRSSGARDRAKRSTRHSPTRSRSRRNRGCTGSSRSRSPRRPTATPALSTTQRDAYREFRVYLTAADPRRRCRPLDARHRDRRGRAADRPRRRGGDAGAVRPGLVATGTAAAGARRRARGAGVRRVWPSSALAPATLTADDLVLSHFSLGRDHPIERPHRGGIGGRVRRHRPLHRAVPEAAGVRDDDRAARRHAGRMRTSASPRSRCSPGGRRRDRRPSTGRRRRWRGNSSTHSRVDTSRRSARTRARSADAARALRCVVRSSGRPRGGRRPRVPPVHEHRRRRRRARHRRARRSTERRRLRRHLASRPRCERPRSHPGDPAGADHRRPDERRPATPDARTTTRTTASVTASRPARATFDAETFVATLIEMGVALPWSLEVCNDDVWGRPGADHVRRVADGMRNGPRRGPAATAGNPSPS